jgi:hypothetical protein
MRPGLTKDDYLRELSKQAAKAEFAALVIGFERETRFVWSGTMDAASRLDKLLSAGGRAFAVLGADIVANAIVYRLDPLPPYDTQEWVRPYLAGVGDTVMEIFKQRWENARN